MAIGGTNFPCGCKATREGRVDVGPIRDVQLSCPIAPSVQPPRFNPRRVPKACIRLGAGKVIGEGCYQGSIAYGRSPDVLAQASSWTTAVCLHLIRLLLRRARLPAYSKPRQQPVPALDEPHSPGVRAGVKRIDSFPRCERRPAAQVLVRAQLVVPVGEVGRECQMGLPWSRCSETEMDDKKQSLLNVLSFHESQLPLDVESLMYRRSKVRTGIVLKSMARLSEARGAAAFLSTAMHPN